MKPISFTVKTPKARSKLAKAVRDPQGAFRPKTERDRTKYTRKVKHSHHQEA